MVSKEELLHIANLANLNIKESETDKYLEHLQDILNYADIVNKINVDGIDVTIAAQESSNVFRKDEIIEFENVDELLQNAKEQQNNMYKIPKVIN